MSAGDDIHAFLAAHRKAQEAFLADLVRVPSDNPPGDCAPHAERAAHLLEAMGLAVERHVVPQEAVTANGMVSCTNLLVRVRFGDGPVIALNAHGDVVPPGLNWTADPYGAEVRDGVMYGRGVAVSKSDFATYAFALRALMAAASKGARFAGTVELHFTYDEEAGGAIGPGWLLAQGVSKPDYAISAGFSYGITTAHNGCLHLAVEIVGRSGHAAEPAKGVDALEAAVGVLSDLYALRKTYAATRSKVPGIESPTLVIGLIRGGINTNVVPDNVVFRIDRRIIPEENPAEVEATLTGQIRDYAAKWPGVTANVTRILLAVPFVPIPGQEKLVSALQRHGEAVVGEPLRTHGVPIYTDARLYTSAGVPAVLYGAGPRTLVEANGHRADEKLVLADLYKATEVVALALADLLTAA
ncbi:MAG TPA: M20/M25/M40 family metallo-hydrolase [Casimicrobiaceae bacterium]|nr:M20/M25/M40 family metallo-hydrolase [Casimicrobiaceae bacterium]